MNLVRHSLPRRASPFYTFSLSGYRIPSSPSRTRPIFEDTEPLFLPPIFTDRINTCRPPLWILTLALAFTYWWCLPTSFALTYWWCLPLLTTDRAGSSFPITLSPASQSSPYHLDIRSIPFHSSLLTFHLNKPNKEIYPVRISGCRRKGRG